MPVQALGVDDGGNAEPGIFGNPALPAVGRFSAFPGRPVVTRIDDGANTLRQFHQRMESEVFSHSGTLDKYLGDGLMATFGTPIASDADAVNALRCARAMMRSMAEWNVERERAGEAPIRASFGLHYGPAVLGDIGSNRLEFAVIGNTVNVASRIEALTRGLKAELAATDDLLERARKENGADDGLLSDLVRHDGVAIRGLEEKMAVWTLPQ